MAAGPVDVEEMKKLYNFSQQIRLRGFTELTTVRFQGDAHATRKGSAPDSD